MLLIAAAAAIAAPLLLYFCSPFVLVAPLVWQTLTARLFSSAVPKSLKDELLISSPQNFFFIFDCVMQGTWWLTD